MTDTVRDGQVDLRERCVNTGCNQTPEATGAAIKLKKFYDWFDSAELALKTEAADRVKWLVFV